MKQMIPILAVLLFVPCFTVPARADTSPLWGDLRPGSHNVGFRLIEGHDPARAIRVKGAAPEIRPRPVRVYIWYPADSSADDTPMLFGSYAALADGDTWPEAVPGDAHKRMNFSRRPLARSLPPDRFDALLKQPVRAFENAKPAAGRFPLIIVGQGLYYESPITQAVLCEFLASHGFVVATTPLTGTHSPLVKIDVTDLETQVRDLEFVVTEARGLPFVSLEKLGLLGFDLGGMSCLILAMRNPDVDAFVSMESAVLFPDLDIPTASPHHDPTLLRAPWLHVLRRELASARGENTPSLFDTAVHSDRYLLLLEGMGHADFTSYALVEDRKPVMGYWGPLRGEEKRRYEAVCLYIFRFFDAYLSGDAESRRFLARDPEDVVPGTTVTIEHRPVTPLRPTDSDFLNALLAGNVADALEMAHSIRQAQPEIPLLQETLLTRLGYHLITSWELAEEAVAVLKLNADLHPQSTLAYESLGEVYLMTGDDEKALPAVRRALELDPDNGSAKGMLEYLNRKNTPSP
jgi:pimeloyl-ACP methyl ester carboxylesterase